MPALDVGNPGVPAVVSVGKLFDDLLGEAAAAKSRIHNRKVGKDTALILSASLLQLFPYLDENMSVDYLSPCTKSPHSLVFFFN